MSGGGSLNRPTVIVTVASGFACVSPAGCLRDHVVVLGLVRRVGELGLDLEALAVSSVAWAVALSRLITSGTVTVAGPFDTFSVTLAWSATSPFPAGVWSTTSFAGWSESTSARRTAKPAACSCAEAWS